MSVVDNYRRLNEEIAQTTLACGRKIEEIKLVAISKGHSLVSIIPVYNQGCRDFGENRLQEVLPKIQCAPMDSRWHFVGTLQKNKVKKAIGQFAMIHSVDSLDLAKKISEASVEQKVVTAILLQANTSGEQSKHGMTPEACFRDFGVLMSLPGLDVQGMMTLAPFVEDVGIISYTFEGLRLLRDRIVAEYHPDNGLQELSMGMSHDFKLAIAEGATILRIGTRIWG